ncbi:leucine-rich repeat domain-containing protein [Methylobacterium sp. GXS13]|uniref:leucine-rich repeat domain-containing protein n=1 Tax=Methylobacterium sp. GXS13 TaxID=1730094 RepID=UPI000AB587B7|nr:leucine-rich repeat domain-containing protein [Methylobacterium sp. GXS13]
MSEDPKYETPEQGYRTARRYIQNNALRRKQRSLDLSRYHLEELPEEIGQLELLEVLNLSHNKLSDLPKELASLTGLRELYLDDNHFSELPSCLFELKNLMVLRASRNILTDLPVGLNNLKSLSTVNFSNNEIAQFPDVLWGMKWLTSIVLDHNNLEELVVSVIDSHDVEFLSLAGNQIREIGEGIAKLKNLTSLDLTANEIRDLPGRITDLAKLVDLKLSDNDLKKLPVGVLSLAYLTFLSIGGNRLRNVPHGLERLRNLAYLNLNSNAIESVPEEIGLLDELSVLNISNNLLSELPRSIANLQKLSSLNLSNNVFVEVPAPVLELRGLNDLDLSSNLLDTLPSGIGNLRRLSQLQIQDNHVTSIPEEIGNLKKLELFGANNNSITKLPEAIGGLNNLWSLSLAGNQIKSLPSIIGNLPFSYNRNLPRYGLHVNKNPLPDPFPKILIHEQPEATDYILAWLRGELTAQALDRIHQEELDFTPLDSFPGIPKQTSGPHFELNENNIISFAPPDAIDADGNNVARLKKLHPPLRDLAADLVRSLSVGNIPQGPLRDRAIAYQDLINCDSESIDFALLYAEGVRLANAERASRHDADLPPLPAPVREITDSLLHLHGAFILSTKEGIESIALEERYRYSPAEESLYKERALDFALELQNRPEIIEPRAARFVQEITQEIGAGRIPERSGAVATGTLKNVAITLSAVSTMASLALVATNSGSAVATVGATAGTWLTLESLKKSKVYMTSTGLLASKIDSLSAGVSGIDIKDLWQHLGPQLRFFERLEPKLRKMAESREELSWINEFYDWLNSRR